MRQAMQNPFIQLEFAKKLIGLSEGLVNWLKGDSDKLTWAEFEELKAKVENLEKQHEWLDARDKILRNQVTDQKNELCKKGTIVFVGLTVLYKILAFISQVFLSGSYSVIIKLWSSLLLSFIFMKLSKVPILPYIFTSSLSQTQQDTIGSQLTNQPRPLITAAQAPSSEIKGWGQSCYEKVFSPPINESRQLKVKAIYYMPKNEQLENRVQQQEQQLKNYETMYQIGMGFSALFVFGLMLDFVFDIAACGGGPFVKLSGIGLSLISANFIFKQALYACFQVSADKQSCQAIFNKFSAFFGFGNTIQEHLRGSQFAHNLEFKLS